MATNRRPKPHASDPQFVKPWTFLGAPSSSPTPATKAAIVGMPSDCGTHPNRIGSRMGPASIREQSTHLRRYDPRTNRDVIADLGLVDCGDVAVTASLIDESFAVATTNITSASVR